MRLIDADELNNFIDKWLSKKCDEHGNTTPNEWLNSLKRCVEEQPTSYDIDKVVSKFGERTDFLKDCTKYGNKNAKQQSESYSTMMMYEVADLVDDLIEIVKQGGVDDDVCEIRKGGEVDER